MKSYYVSSARELVRINGTTKAPVMNYASESILGVVTIRAFAAIDRFIHSNMELIDTDATLFFHTVAAQEWVLIRVEALQSLTIITAALFLVLVPPGVISPGSYITITIRSRFYMVSLGLLNVPNMNFFQVLLDFASPML